MIVLGLDPGLAAMGWGVVRWNIRAQAPEHVAHGCLRTTSDAPMLRRVEQLSRELRGLLGTHAPDQCAAEAWIWYGRAAGAGTHVLRVCGAIAGIATDRGLPYAEYSARAVKLAVTGSANGEKLAVQRAVQKALSLGKLPRPDHAADALAVALTHLAALRASVRVVTRGVDVFGNADTLAPANDTAPPARTRARRSAAR